MYFGHISRVLLQALLRAMRGIESTTLISIMSFIVSRYGNVAFQTAATICNNISTHCYILVSVTINSE